MAARQFTFLDDPTQLAGNHRPQLGPSNQFGLADKRFFARLHLHCQLEAARAVFAADPARGMLAVSRAQALAKDGLTAVRQSVKALREDAPVDGLADQLASIVESVRDESFAAVFITAGTPRSVSAQVALALQRTTLEGEIS